MVVGYQRFLEWTRHYNVRVEGDTPPGMIGLLNGGLELLLRHGAFPCNRVMVLADDEAVCCGSHFEDPADLNADLLILQAEEPVEYGTYPVLAELTRQKSSLLVQYTEAGLWIIGQELLKKPPQRQKPVQYRLDFTA